MYENILRSLPSGSIIGESYLDPADNTQLIIEYYHGGTLHRVSPERININTKLKGNKSNVYFIEGMTYNDVYQIQSDLHQLNLVKGEDYDDNPNPITKLGGVYLPISKRSSKYKPGTMMAIIVDKKTVFPESEETRNISNESIEIFNSEIEKGFFRLATKLFDVTDIKSFNQSLMTFQFRNKIISILNEEKTDTLLNNEILSSFIIDAFNDGLTDNLVLKGPSNIPYLLRYQSAPDDIPKF